MALGLALLAMAAPRLVAGLATLPYEDLWNRVAYQRPVEGAELAAAAQAYGTALEWHDEAYLAADLASLNYSLARGLGFSGDGARAFLERSVAAARRALAGNPGQPYAWLLLSLGLERLEGPSPASAAALVQSLRRGAWQPRLALPRAGLALRAWPLLDGEARALAAVQVRIAAELDPAGLARLIPGPALWRVVQDLLVEQPELLRAVEAARG